MPHKDRAVRREYRRQYWQRRRDEERATNPRPSKEENFWAGAIKTATCWIWTRAKTNKGYGRLTWNYEHWLAHRLAYTLTKGPIPDGLHLDHLCRAPACINPNHLEAVTMRENTMRGNNFTAIHARKTHCPRGHSYDVLLENGWRRCSSCYREQNNQATRKYKRKIRMQAAG